MNNLNSFVLNGNLTTGVNFQQGITITHKLCINYVTCCDVKIWDETVKNINLIFHASNYSCFKEKVALFLNEQS